MSAIKYSPEIAKMFRHAVNDANTYADYITRLDVLNSLANDFAVNMFDSTYSRDYFKRDCGLDDWSA